MRMDLRVKAFKLVAFILALGVTGISGKSVGEFLSQYFGQIAAEAARLKPYG